MLNSSSSLSFRRRGLPGLLFIALGLTLSAIFRKSSAWPADTQHQLFLLALVLAVGGSNLLSNYVRPRPLTAMKTELFASLCLVVTLALLR